MVIAVPCVQIQAINQLINQSINQHLFAIFHYKRKVYTIDLARRPQETTRLVDRGRKIEREKTMRNWSQRAQVTSGEAECHHCSRARQEQACTRENSRLFAGQAQRLSLVPLHLVSPQTLFESPCSVQLA